MIGLRHMRTACVLPFAWTRDDTSDNVQVPTPCLYTSFALGTLACTSIGESAAGLGTATCVCYTPQASDALPSNHWGPDLPTQRHRLVLPPHLSNVLGSLIH